MAERTPVVWQFIAPDVGTLQYTIMEPDATFKGVVPFYNEPAFEGQPPGLYRHDVLEPHDVRMTLYYPSPDNPWEGNGECTSTPLYS